jgi:uncharacterized protein (DUF1499 family)
MKMELKRSLAALGLAVLMGGCASTPANPGGADPGLQALSCLLPTNCVNSLGDGALKPLTYAGPPERGLAVLQATLGDFAEAQVVRSEPLWVEAIFTTRVGFRDQVDFRIDPASQRIDYRSRSLFGLFDFFKNRSRMEEFAARFAQMERR